MVGTAHAELVIQARLKTLLLSRQKKKKKKREYIHPHQKVISIMKVRLCQTNPHGENGLLMQPLTIGPRGGYGVTTFMNNMTGVSSSHGKGNRSENGQLHTVQLNCYTIGMEWIQI